MTADVQGWRLARETMTEYLLHSEHRTGQHKAAVFASVGFSTAHPDELEAALLDHPVRNVVARKQSTEYGTKLDVRCTMRTPDGRNPCMVSVWMLKSDGVARLVTACPGPARAPPPT